MILAALTATEGAEMTEPLLNASYFCSVCGHTHNTASRIGRDHRRFVTREGAEMTGVRYQYKIFVNGRREPELFETTEPTTLGAARMYADVLGLNQWRSRVERHDHIVFDNGTRIVASPHIARSMTLRLPS